MCIGGSIYLHDQHVWACTAFVDLVSSNLKYTTLLKQLLIAYVLCYKVKLVLRKPAIT